MVAGTRLDETDAPPLPSWLARHVKIGFDSDDVAALIDAIDSSQNVTPAPHLPAELVLQILKSVPVDHLLDWRLVSRGFRDAIDGRVLFHHLRRTELIGYLGSRHSRPMEHLDDQQYDKVHLLRASFCELQDTPQSGTQRTGPTWSRTHAVFQIEDAWFEAFRRVGGAAAQSGHSIEQADAVWFDTLDRLELRKGEIGFGTLRWCIGLDHAVLDMAFPLEKGRVTFDIDVNLHRQSVRVEWKPMLFNFLKTEAALRRKLIEKEDCVYTFTHAEDCLRHIRRQRLHSTLDSNDRIDRHIKWSLRLLPPLFGRCRHDTTITLEEVENDATSLLLLLRREAAMSSQQIAHLHQLATDYKAMEKVVDELEQAFGEFKRHLTMSGFQMSIAMPAFDPTQIPPKPTAWPDELRIGIEGLVGKWKSQKKAIQQMKGLLGASNTALAVSEDSFDDLGSDFSSIAG